MRDSDSNLNDSFETYEDVQMNDEEISSDVTARLIRKASRLIAEKKYDEADMILIDIPKCDRTAEWYYQMGLCEYSKGWNNRANSFIKTACEMDPENHKYSVMLKKIEKASKYNYGGYSDKKEKLSVCDCCEACECCIDPTCCSC